MTLIAAAIQFRPRLATCMADVKDNLRRCEPLLHEAWKVGANLVVFPELAMTGYSFLSPDEAFRVAEQAGTGSTSLAMAAIASSLHAHVVWGFVESADGVLHNSAAAASPEGTVTLLTRKLNLWGNDFLWARPGMEMPKAVQTDFGMLTALVCRDVRGRRPPNGPRTASAAELVPPRVDVIAVPANWGKGGFPAVAWMDLAAASGRHLVVANRWGTEENGSFSQDFGQGGSAVVSPSWQVHTGGLQFGADCVVTACVEVGNVG